MLEAELGNAFRPYVASEEQARAPPGNRLNITPPSLHVPSTFEEKKKKKKKMACHPSSCKLTRMSCDRLFYLIPAGARCFPCAANYLHPIDTFCQTFRTLVL